MTPKKSSESGSGDVQDQNTGPVFSSLGETLPSPTFERPGAHETEDGLARAKRQETSVRTREPRRRPGDARRRLRMAEALRLRGLDEFTIAGVVRKFIRSRSSEKRYDRLLLEMVKQVFRILEPPCATAKAAEDSNVSIQLIHAIDRPVRD